MEEKNYWTKLSEQRLSRRRLLGGATALAAGGAALSLVGCSSGGGGGGTTPGATAQANPTTTGTIGENIKDKFTQVQTRGGVIRGYQYEPLPLDTLDPHQTQFGPTYDLHASLLSKVLQYDDVYQGIIKNDLATGLPEQPDHQTYIIHLRDNIRFHNSDAIRAFAASIGAGSVPGRQLTAEDVKYSIERQTNRSSPKAGLYYRADQWASVDSIQVMNDTTLKITTKAPTAPFIHFLADSNAFIVAKEMVDQATDDMTPNNEFRRLIGTGPFMWDQYVPLQISRALRNPDWHAADDNPNGIGMGRPFLDRYEVLWIPQDATAQEAAFRNKEVDDFGVDDRQAVDRVASSLNLPVRVAPSSGYVNSRLLINDSPAAKTPFKDFRLRQALNIAIDRSRLNQQMLNGTGYFPGPVAQAIQKWAIKPGDLAKKPGYRFGAADRQQDLTDAKQMWEAAGGASVGTVTITNSGIPAYLSQAMPQVKQMLKDVLGLDASNDEDTTGYTKLAQGLLEKRLVMTFGYDNGWNDLDDWVYPYFYTNGTKNSFNFSDPDLDKLLDQERQEFDTAKRQQIGYDIQNYLLDKVAGMLMWVSPAGPSCQWPYLRNTLGLPWFGNSFHRADVWVDTSDPSYQGRKS